MIHAADALRYGFLDPHARSKAPVRIRVKPLGGRPVLCRNGTSDWNVLWSVFHENYHLPDLPLPPGSCILDLGANVGYTTAHFAALFPDARVVGVEMDAENFRLAVENTQAFGERCLMIEGAVSSHDGMLTYSGEQEDAFHLVAEGQSPPAGAKRVRAFSMGTLCREAALERIDFLKMDIEGAERDVFSSDLAWLPRVYHAKIEVHNQADFALIEEALRSAGFSVAKDTRHWSALVATRRG